ncbi:MAG: mercury methylation ferredoxin HgcB [Victivallaceae bacterium]|nr:mercury methylation ferredoxin HgcB [Victivallaceae bacterium]
MFLYIKDTATLKIDGDRCSGCGFCLNVCPRGVLAMQNRKVVIKEKDACIECGACAKNCPAEAIAVRTGVGCATAILSGSGQCGKCGCGK